MHNVDAALIKFERYQQKIDYIEAQVDAYDLTESQNLTKQINTLATNDSVSDELAQMKKNLVTC